MKAPIVVMCVALLGAGCATGRQSAPQTYDFGLAATPESARNSVQVAEIRAPEWLDTSQMFYRLAYQDPRVLSPYAGSRWAGAPGSMLTLRLRQELGSIPGGKCILSAGLMEFSQVFDSASSSRAVLHLQAVLASGGAQGRRLQREFRLEAAASTADAAGGAAAFSSLASTLARSLDQWIAESGLCTQS